MKKIRLDQLVFDLGLTESRERAKTTVMSGLVFVNGQRADKPGMQVSPDANVEVKGAALPYVSRGGFKLEKALKVFPVDPEDKVCIDCGASTGGFTDVLLQNGAKKSVFGRCGIRSACVESQAGRACYKHGAHQYKVH